jgi:ABC-type sugar transport system permease subunit
MNWFHRRRWWGIAMFVGPALALYLAFLVVPLFTTFYNSVHTIHMAHPSWEREYIGLENYSKLLPEIKPAINKAQRTLRILPFYLEWPDKIFRMAIGNSLLWSFTAPLLNVLMGFLLALILYSRIPGGRFFRNIWFTPVLFSWVVVGIILRWVLNYDWGVVNSLLRAVGLGSLARNWLGLPSTALFWLIAVTNWKWVGVHMAILLAALSSIPEDLLDSARIDGCNRVQLIWHMVIPLMRSTLVSLLILSFIGNMKQFALVWVSTRGGPMHHTETVATYVQKRAFEWRTLDLGYPSAIAVLWFFVILGLSLLFARILQRREALEY